MSPLVVFDSIQVQIQAYSQIDPLVWPTGYASLLVDDLTELILSNGDELDYLKSFSLSPNPFADFVTISSAKNIIDKIYLEVFDTAGKLVFSEELSSVSDESVVSTKTWARGKYVFVFYNMTTKSIESLSAIKM